MAKQSKSRYVMIDNTGRIWIDSDLTPNRLKTLVRELERFGVYVHERPMTQAGTKRMNHSRAYYLTRTIVRGLFALACGAMFLIALSFTLSVLYSL